MRVASDPSFLRALINHRSTRSIFWAPRRTRSIASVRKSLAVDGGAVMRDFLSPFGLKCILPVAADHVVRRKTGYDQPCTPRL